MKEFATETKEYRKKPLTVKAYQTDKEFEIETLEGTMTASVGDFIITGVAGEQYPCKPDVFYATYDVEDSSFDDNVISNLREWSSLITELCAKEIELSEAKEEYQGLSLALLEEARTIKEENEHDIIKAKYGGNNDKTRKKYVEETLVDEHEAIVKLERRIDYIKRRVPFLKSLIRTKTVLLEIKG